MSFAETCWQYKGVYFPYEITKETLEAMPNFQMRDDDITVASYGKTGTNWLLEIISKILKAAGKVEKSADVAFSPMEMKTFMATQPGYVHLADMPSPRLIHTHLPIQFAPRGIAKPQNKVKVLVPMRNPKDVVVSMFHFLNKTMQLSGRDVFSWEYFADAFISEEVMPYGDYCDHLLGWWQMRDDPHFLFLKYEDMKKDLLSAVKTVKAFLEVDLDETTMEDIAEASTFDNMKAEWDGSKEPDRKVVARKGIVGDWKNMFSPEQSKAYDDWYEKKLGGTGITFDFE